MSQWIGSELAARIEFNAKFAARNGFESGLSGSPNPSTEAFVDWTVEQQRELSQDPNVNLGIDGYFGTDTWTEYKRVRGLYVEPGVKVPLDTSPGVIAYGRSIGTIPGVRLVRWFDGEGVPSWLPWSGREGERVAFLGVHEPVTSLAGMWRSFNKDRYTESTGRHFKHGVHFTLGLDGTVYQHNALEDWLVNLPGWNKSGISIEPENIVNGKIRDGELIAPSPYEGLILPAPWISHGSDEGYTIPTLAQLRSFVALASFLLPLRGGQFDIDDRILGYDRESNRFLIGRLDTWKQVDDDPFGATLPGIAAHKWVGSHTDGVYYMLVLTLVRELGFSVEDAQWEAASLLTDAKGQWIDLPERRGPRALGATHAQIAGGSTNDYVESSGALVEAHYEPGQVGEDPGIAPVRPKAVSEPHWLVKVAVGVAAGELVRRLIDSRAGKGR